MKTFAIWTGVALFLVASVWGLLKLADKPSTLGSSTQSIQAPEITESDVTRGNKKAKVVLIEYSDFQCPACAYYHSLVKQLTDKYKDRMLFAYRFFPLRQIHKNAVSSSQAAYAAHLQGKFWEMHDLLFENQTDWSDSGNAKDIFESFAKELGLNEEKFKQDMDSSETVRIINSQYSVGAQAGVNSTPTFFLNGELIQNPQSYEDFKKLIQAKLDNN